MTRHRINVHLKPNNKNKEGDIVLETESGNSIYIETDTGAQSIDYGQDSEVDNMWKNNGPTDTLM